MSPAASGGRGGPRRRAGASWSCWLHLPCIGSIPIVNLAGSFPPSAYRAAMTTPRRPSLADRVDGLRTATEFADRDAAGPGDGDDHRADRFALARLRTGDSRRGDPPGGAQTRTAPSAIWRRRPRRATVPWDSICGRSTPRTCAFTSAGRRRLPPRTTSDAPGDVDERRAHQAPGERLGRGDRLVALPQPVEHGSGERQQSGPSRRCSRASAFCSRRRRTASRTYCTAVTSVMRDGHGHRDVDGPAQHLR